MRQVIYMANSNRRILSYQEQVQSRTFTGTWWQCLQLSDGVSVRKHFTALSLLNIEITDKNYI